MSRFACARPLVIAAASLWLCACHSGGDDDDDGGNNDTSFTVGGTVTGLSGGNFVLRLNGANDLAVNASGTFAFNARLASGTSYTVTLLTSPTGQVCTLASNTGTIASANVTNVAISCFGFSIGGTVTGLTKPGLVLTVNNGNDLSVPAQASSFTFPGTAQLGPTLGLYFAGIKTQPTGQTCTIIRSMGGVTATASTVTGSTGPAVDCVDNVTDPFRGTYNVVDDADTDARAYVTFFPDGTYLLGVHNDEPACVDNGNGIQYGVYNWNQATQVLRIVKHAPIGLGSECGFDVGTTVTLSKDDDGTIALIEYENNVPRYAGTMVVVPSTSGTLIGSWGIPHTFAVFTGDGRFFLATARTIVQNTSAFPGIEDGCYTVSGTNASGSLTFNLTSSCSVGGGKTAVDTTGASAFSIHTAPVSFTVNADVMQSGAGLPASPFFGSAPRIQATQLPATHSINATISGLTGTGLTLQYNGKSGGALAQGTTTTVVATGVPTQTSYAVVVRQQPTGQYCAIANGSGILFANVTNIAVTCTAIPGTTYSVGGTVGTLPGLGLSLRLNGQLGADFNVTTAPGATSYEFAARLQMGAPFSVLAVNQTPGQFCIPTSPPAGTIVASNVAVSFSCLSSSTYTVGGSVNGLAASANLTLRLNYYDAAGVPRAPASGVVSNNGAFTTFATETIPASGIFELGIAAQPAGQTCTIVRGRATGGLGGAATNTVATVACVANTTDPLRGTYSALHSNGQRWYFNFNADGTYTTAMIHNEWGCESSLSPQNVGNGVEYGVFTWNQATGAFHLPVQAAIDTNGSCGLSSDGDSFDGFITRVGNTIEIRETTGGPIIASVPAVQSNSGTLVGGWTREAGNGALLVFHADGTFLYVDTQTAGLHPSLYGQERGCYTANAGGTLLTFTVDAACRPDGLASYDMNAFGGLVTAPVVSSTTLPFTLAGDTLTFNGIVYKRTQPN